MKKAVAHLIPFMEEERALKAQELKAQGLEVTDEVNSLICV
jgi:cobalamin-dependent methionine synthase I